jgi:hypothetical protein
LFKKGVVGKSKFSDVAIDDIYMSSKACTAPGNCDFEDGNFEYCTWMNLNEKSKKITTIKEKVFSPANGTQITLKCIGNNMYVCAENSGTNPLVANRDSVYQGDGSWEAFTYIKHDDGTFSLISSANDKYVSGLTTGIAYFDYLHADQDSPMKNETRFILNQNQDGSYSFRSKVNLKYVSASNLGFGPLWASQTKVGDQFFESFIIEPFQYQSSGLYDWEIYASGGIFGSIADHTLGGSGDGHFIIANGKNQGDYSRIFSQILEKTSDSGMCLSFYYYFNAGTCLIHFLYRFFF